MVGRRWKICISLFVLCLLSVNYAFSQSTLSLYFLDNHFNSSVFNPAFNNPENKFTLSIFPLAGSSLVLNNLPLTRDIIEKVRAGVSSNNDYKDITKTLSEAASFNQSFDLTLLNFSYKSNYGNFNFRINEKGQFSSGFNGIISDFVIKPGTQSIPIDFVQKLPAQAIHYREYSLGYSNKAGNRLSYGTRIKLLFGKGAFYSDLEGTIQKYNSDFLLKTSGIARISFPETQIVNNLGNPQYVVDISGKKTKEYLLNNNNPGYGIDLGLKYRLSHNLTFSFSINDIGRINWKSNLNSKIMDGKFIIDNSNVTSQFDPEGNVIISKINTNISIADSISKLFQVIYDRTEFAESLPVKVYASLKYDFRPNISFGIVNMHHYELTNNLDYNSLLLNMNYKLNHYLTISSGYSIIGKSYINLPLSVLYDTNYFQAYLSFDNMLALITSDDSSVYGFGFGACFYLFKKRRNYKKTNQYLPFYRERLIRTDEFKGLLIN